MRRRRGCRHGLSKSVLTTPNKQAAAGARQSSKHNLGAGDHTRPTTPSKQLCINKECHRRLLTSHIMPSKKSLGFFLLKNFHFKNMGWMES